MPIDLRLHRLFATLDVEYSILFHVHVQITITNVFIPILGLFALLNSCKVLAMHSFLMTSLNKHYIHKGRICKYRKSWCVLFNELDSYDDTETWRGRIWQQQQQFC